jgi:heme exporter protein CcmD
MGGYGFYVWGSYGLMALAILIELAMLRRRRRDALIQAAHASQEDD